VNNTGTKYVRIMKQTAFWKGENGEYIQVKNSAEVEYLLTLRRLTTQIEVVTAQLTAKLCILYIYSTNIGTEYFKHGIHSPFFSSSKCSLFHNSNVFDSCIIHILYIYSTNIDTEYFKHGIYSPFFLSWKCIVFHNSNVFGSCIIHILYIYSKNTGTEYFKHSIYAPLFPLQNAVYLIILTYFVPLLFTFCILIQQI